MARRTARTEDRLAAEGAAAIDTTDAARLQRKLNLWRWMLWPLFPRGFAFEAGGNALVYDPRRGRVRIELAGDYGHMRRPAALLRWLGCGLRRSLPRRLQLPP